MDGSWMDGAHNMMSLEQVAEWFSNATTNATSDSQMFHILIFSHFPEDRDGVALALAEYLAHPPSKHNAAPDCVILSSRPTGRVSADPRENKGKVEKYIHHRHC
ncbi:hypothetical protein EMPG_11128 [Blastomyces silverae]|uniref:Uncharacterized protein n=1 Tax=Blastomyces silverae TaxID=2060906 RepID=A0A0H1B2X0_9EURO|nr:hypothetical protein EMPG_11128 [Blastomyces silverae]